MLSDYQTLQEFCEVHPLAELFSLTEVPAEVQQAVYRYYKHRRIGNDPDEFLDDIQSALELANRQYLDQLALDSIEWDPMVQTYLERQIITASARNSGKNYDVTDTGSKAGKQIDTWSGKDTYNRDYFKEYQGEQVRRLIDLATQITGGYLDEATPEVVDYEYNSEADAGNRQALQNTGSSERSATRKDSNGVRRDLSASMPESDNYGAQTPVPTDPVINPAAPAAARSAARSAAAQVAVENPGDVDPIPNDPLPEPVIRTPGQIEPEYTPTIPNVPSTLPSQLSWASASTQAEALTGGHEAGRAAQEREGLQVDYEGTRSRKHAAAQRWKSGTDKVERTYQNYKEEQSGSYSDGFNGRRDNDKGRGDTEYGKVVTREYQDFKDERKKTGGETGSQQGLDDTRYIHSGRQMSPQELMSKALDYIRRADSTKWLIKQLDTLFMPVLSYY